jgi:hypothetical protein
LIIFSGWICVPGLKAEHHRSVPTLAFWNGCTKDRVSAALNGALGDWIRDNASGSAVFIVVGIVAGPFSLAFALPAITKGVDLAATFVTKIIESEVAAGVLTSGEGKTIARALGFADGVAQIPALIKGEGIVERAAGALGAANNVLATFTSESDNLKLGVTITTDTVGKYAFALNALKEL